MYELKLDFLNPELCVEEVKKAIEFIKENSLKNGSIGVAVHRNSYEAIPEDLLKDLIKITIYIVLKEAGITGKIEELNLSDIVEAKRPEPEKKPAGFNSFMNDLIKENLKIKGAKK